MNKVAIQVVTWNSIRYINECLESLQNQTFQDFSVMIIDNASRDGTVEFVRTNYPTASVLENFKNIGFAKANNQGVKLGKSEYVLVMNPDVVLTPDFLDKLVAFADKHPEGGSFGSKILKLKTQAFDESDQGLRESIHSDLIDSTGLQIYKTRKITDRGQGQKDEGQYDRVEEVFGITGACVLYRRSALDDAMISNQYFDNDFFAYKEDADLAWRLRLYGHSSWYTPDPVCYHHRGVGAAKKSKIRGLRKHRRQISKMLRSASMKNHHLMLVKNEQAINILLTLPWFLGRGLGIIFYSFFFEPFQFKTLKIFFRQLPAALRHRKIIMAHAKASPEEIRKWFN